MRRSLIAPISDKAKRNLVGGECDRLGVKISARDDLAGLDQHQRIVRDGVGLDRQRAGGLHQQVKRGAGHLRLTAQAIGILHALVAFEMRLADVAAFQQRRQGGAGRDLARHARAVAGSPARNGAVEAIAASTDKAPVTSVAQSRPWARNNPEMA